MARDPRPVVIIGGGISGLAASYELGLAGIPQILLEKRPRLGGVIETRRDEDCVLEGGPDSFLAAKPDALALIKELGLESQVIGSNDHNRTTYIVKNGRLVALPEGVMMIVPSKIMPMVKSPLLSWATKIRMGLEYFRKPSTPGDRSVAEFVVDHYGQETLDYLAEPLLSGVYGGDPREMSVGSVLPRFVEMESKYGSLTRGVLVSRRAGPPKTGVANPGAPKPTAPKIQGGASLFKTLKGGLGSLVDALGSRPAVRDAVRHSEAEMVERLAAGGFRVRVGGEWIEASGVIFACPAWAAAPLLKSIDGDLAGLLYGIPYSSSLTVTMLYRNSEFDGKRAGFGFLVPQKERRRMAACTFVTTKFPDRAPDDRIIVRCFFGGSGDEAVLKESDESLVDMARGELRQILGLKAAPFFHTISRWPRSMAQYNVGHAERIRGIEARAAAIPGLYLAGNAYSGIGIPDCIRTGRSAAKKIASVSS